MKKFYKSTLALMLVLVTVLGISITAFAATTRYFPFDSGHKLKYANPEKWERIAYSTGGGLSCNILICVQDDANDYTDVLMTDQYGNEVWSESMAIQHNHTRIFYCGSNVYNVYVKTNKSGVTAYGWATHAP